MIEELKYELFWEHYVELNGEIYEKNLHANKLQPKLIPSLIDLKKYKRVCIIDNDKNKIYIKKNKGYHVLDNIYGRPSIILNNGTKGFPASGFTKKWYKNGKLHRRNKPAIEYYDSSKEWYLNNKRHRLDGPAKELINEYKIWYINDIYLEKEQFNSWVTRILYIFKYGS